jgi:hypothetical protein
MSVGSKSGINEDKVVLVGAVRNFVENMNDPPMIGKINEYGEALEYDNDGGLLNYSGLGFREFRCGGQGRFFGFIGEGKLYVFLIGYHSGTKYKNGRTYDGKTEFPEKYETKSVENLGKLGDWAKKALKELDEKEEKKSRVVEYPPDESESSEDDDDA